MSIVLQGSKALALIHHLSRSRFVIHVIENKVQEGQVFYPIINISLNAMGQVHHCAKVLWVLLPSVSRGMSYEVENIPREICFCHSTPGRHISWNKGIKADGGVVTGTLKVFSQQLSNLCF